MENSSGVELVVDPLGRLGERARQEGGETPNCASHFPCVQHSRVLVVGLHHNHEHHTCLRCGTLLFLFAKSQCLTKNVGDDGFENLDWFEALRKPRVTMDRGSLGVVQVKAKARFAAWPYHLAKK